MLLLNRINYKVYHKNLKEFHIILPLNNEQTHNDTYGFNFIQKRTMKSGGSKIVKEVSKEFSKTPSPKSSTTSLNSLNQNKNVSLEQPQIDSNNTKSSVEASKKLPQTMPYAAPMEEVSKNLANNTSLTSPTTTSQKNFTTLPTLSNLKDPQFISKTEQFVKPSLHISQRDYRAVRLADPDNTVFDNTSKNEKAPWHVRTHSNVEDDRGILIGLMTSGKKPNENFVPEYLTDTNYKGEGKTQLIALFTESHKICDPQDITEDKEATLYLKQKIVEEKIDAIVERNKENQKKLPIRKLVNKNDMVNEDGSPREDVPKDD